MSQTPPPAIEARSTRKGSCLARQMAECIVILSVGILLFRAFAAEAYVVPSGSMAPTLIGNHREIACPNCGMRFPLGLDDEGRTGRPVCPNCGRDGLDDVPTVECGGDRVLVQKLVFDFRRPRRWEVAVFHFPGDPSQAYVKRVVGLPLESIRIVGGDVFADGRIARKTLREQRASRISVFDNDFTPRDASRYPRWVFRQADPRRGRLSGWRAEDSTFLHEKPEGLGDSIDWLEYRHWDPERGRYASIHDFNAYNGGDLPGENAIKDLMLEARVTAGRGAEAVVIRLDSGADRFFVTLPLSETTPPTVRRSGRLLAVSNLTPMLLKGFRSGRRTLLEVSAMDRRLQVAVNGELLFDPMDYDDPAEGPGPTESPLAIGIAGGAIKVEGVRLYRDIYYTGFLAGTPRSPFGVDSPYFLGHDEFFVLGDNSPVSNDSRFWPNSPVVRGEMFLGKPFLVHLPGQVVPFEVFGRSVYWVPDPREIRYIR